jgi:hypothetical protein
MKTYEVSLSYSLTLEAEAPAIAVAEAIRRVQGGIVPSEYITISPKREGEPE